MEMRHCPNCGAPLAIGEPGALERCHFCGAELREDRAPEPVRPPDLLPPAPQSRAWGVPIAIVIAVAGLFVFLIARHSIRSVTHGKVAGTTLTESWQPIEVRTPATPRIDPYEQVAWATGIARGWKSDATLMKLLSNGVGADGFVTLADTTTAWAQYSFESPSCWSAKTHDACGMTVMLDAPHGRVIVEAAEYEKRGKLQPIGPVACSLSQALAAFTRAVPYASPPFQVSLDDAGTTKWRFYGAGTHEFPYVSTTSCAVVPVEAADTGARCIMPFTPSTKPTPKPAGPRCPADPTGPFDLPHQHVVFPDKTTVDVEVARTLEQRKRGLFYRASLAEGAGMLFVGDDKVQHFWMHAACIPLDLLFIDDEGTIVGAIEDAPPLDDRDESVACVARYVLAVNAGWIDRHGVRPGQRVTFD